MREQDRQCEILNDTLRRKRLIQSLAEHNINSEEFIAATPELRLKMIIDCYHLGEPPDYGLTITPKIDDGLGLMVVKPELYDEAVKVERYLYSLGIRVVQTKTFTYKPEQYWSTYGHTFLRHFDVLPYCSLLFLINITSPSKLITFEHLTVEGYRSLYNSLGADFSGGNGDVVDDPQALFDAFFVRNGHFSLRNTVVLPIIIDKHLDTMDPDFGLDVYWDFTGTFRKRRPEENIVTFNGIHSPNNAHELSYDKLILLDDKGNE